MHLAVVGHEDDALAVTGERPRGEHQGRRLAEPVAQAGAQPQVEGAEAELDRRVGVWSEPCPPVRGPCGRRAPPRSARSSRSGRRRRGSDRRPRTRPSSISATVSPRPTPTRKNTSQVRTSWRTSSAAMSASSRTFCAMTAELTWTSKPCSWRRAIARIVSAKWPGIWRTCSWVAADAPSKLSEAVTHAVGAEHRERGGVQARRHRRRDRDRNPPRSARTTVSSARSRRCRQSPPVKMRTGVGRGPPPARR